MGLSSRAAIGPTIERDDCTLDRAALETMRLMTIERVREREPPPEVAASYVFSLTTIYKWIKAAAHPDLGLRALRTRKAPGRARKLTPAQEHQVFRWIDSRDGHQYGLDFGLWSRIVVGELLADRFGVHFVVTTVGPLLRDSDWRRRCRCNAPTSATRKPSNGGNGRPSRRLSAKPGNAVAVRSSETNRPSVPMRSMTVLGACGARPPSFIVLGNDGRAAQRRRSMPAVPSCSVLTRARSIPICS